MRASKGSGSSFRKRAYVRTIPRAMVGPGSASKRSASSDSIWRGMNLSCCATSARPRPCASLASASALPTPSNASPVTEPRAALLKLAPLQRLVLRRIGEAAAQLGSVARFGHALAALALDPQRQPQRLGGRGDELVVARHQLARIADIAL